MLISLRINVGCPGSVGAGPKADLLIAQGASSGLQILDEVLGCVLPQVRLFAQVTQALVGKRLAIILDAKVISAGLLEFEAARRDKRCRRFSFCRAWIPV